MAARKMQIALIRGTVVDGQPRKPGTKMTVDKRLAELLISAGKAKAVNPKTEAGESKAKATKG